jgi:hypothetical protein
MPVFLAGTFALFSYRLLDLINQKSVNILFWDQWDFLTPLFEGKGAWDLFNWQHGLHRMGAGYFLIQALAELTGWNTRADAFAILGLVMLAALAALLLKKRLFGSLSAWDVLVFAIFLTASQYEIFIGTPDESAGAFPLLLLILLCLGWTIDRPAVRLAVVLVLNFLTLYTGYGFIAAPITAGLFGVQLFQGFRVHSKSRAWISGVGLLGSIGSILIFMNGYVFYANTGCPEVHLTDLVKFPVFSGVSFARFVGLDVTELRWPAIILGVGLAAIFAGILGFQMMKHAADRVSHDKIRLAIIFLMGYSLLFSVSAAAGRFCMGLASAQASRYMTLLIPAFLGLYFFILTIRKPGLRHLALGAFAVAVICAQLPYGQNDQRIIHFFSDEKESWKTCYLAYENIDRCNQETDFQIYPVNDERLQSRLDSLKHNQRNLYLDDFSPH